MQIPWELQLCVSASLQEHFTSKLKNKIFKRTGIAELMTEQGFSRTTRVFSSVERNYWSCAGNLREAAAEMFVLFELFCRALEKVPVVSHHHAGDCAVIRVNFFQLVELGFVCA